MSFTTSELQLAATVWQIAVDIADDEWRRARAESDINEDEWNKAHPFTDSLDEAMRQIRGVARYIKTSPQNDEE